MSFITASLLAWLHYKGFSQFVSTDSSSDRVGLERQHREKA